LAASLNQAINCAFDRILLAGDPDEEILELGQGFNQSTFITLTAINSLKKHFFGKNYSVDRGVLYWNFFLEPIIYFGLQEHVFDNFIFFSRHWFFKIKVIELSVFAL
jgi:hypothetical protein